MPLQQDVAATARHLHAAGWVANHDGNVSARATDQKRFFATPTAVSKRLINADDVVTVDLAGKVLAGRKKLFGEWHLHAACYAARPDVAAVVHAHPIHASAIGLARRSLGVPGLPEMVVSLGKSIPTLEYAMPKSPGQDAALKSALTAGDADVVLIAGNGVVAVGADLEQALLRLELVEHYAKMWLAALPLGGITALPESDLQKLLEARTKAGLGQAARRG
ncbi:MAG: class II aldolase/adducin family protein [Deltaproteobacteria bacterium]|nr:class II aldolase/adducin family protein [Deltaproteobacteria bacterium]